VKTSNVRTHLNFLKENVDILAWHEILEIFLGGEPDPFANYFVKTGFDEYHKIVIPAQH
jgi:hypothetical protein